MSLEDLDPAVELTPTQARRLLSFILKEGEVLFSRHARAELEAEHMTEQDAVNVIRAGRIYEPGELVAESWRYRCHTQRFCVVVAFASTAQAVVVTAWRKS